MTAIAPILARFVLPSLYLHHRMAQTVSEDTRRLTNGAFEYEPRGPVELRGLGAMTTYLVARAQPIRQSGTSPYSGQES